MLERIGALETEDTFEEEQARMEAEQARMAAEATTEPMILLPFGEPDAPGSSPPRPR